MIRRNLVLVLLAVFALMVPHTAFAGDVVKGKSVYELNCSSCHGATGKADGPVGQALNPSPRDFAAAEFKFDADKNGTPGEDTDLKLIITKGAAPYGGNPSMAPWGHLSDADVDNVIAFVRSLKQ